MERKYKFFIKQNAVIFKQAAGFRNDNNNLNLSDQDAETLTNWIGVFELLSLEEDCIVEVENLEVFISKLQEGFTCIHAAGGYVLNDKGQLLMIHRRGFWDLPKGKVDPGETLNETAVREVEEECGVSSLAIVSSVFSTFHLYKEKGAVVIKESHWFRMETTHDKELVPQTEEDIEQALWVDLPVSKAIRSGAYSSINEVLDHYA